MLESFTGDQHEFILADGADVVPDYATHPGGIADEVQFALAVGVQRVVELALVAFYYVETVLVGQASDF
jgi:hypothetical protein